MFPQSIRSNPILTGIEGAAIATGGRNRRRSWIDAFWNGLDEPRLSKEPPMTIELASLRYANFFTIEHGHDSRSLPRYASTGVQT